MGLKKIVFTIAVTMAITITLGMNHIGQLVEKKLPSDASSSSTVDLGDMQEIKPMPSKRLGRFLTEDHKNPRAGEYHHCYKDNQVCYASKGYNSTCCNNKCMDLSEDKHNCGACKKRCKFTEECCQGRCVNIAFDKRHCGRCNNQCPLGEYCVYGMCNYA
ncbi:hypothetical protein SLA2020_304740 [Shorea laevis]